MTSKFNLNCLVLGDHPRNIFPVKITWTDTVGDLKDTLQLWKVDLPVDDTLGRNHLDELELDHKTPLSPVDEIFEVFDSPPQHKHLHIVVQPLPAGVSRKASHLSIKLNCLVLGDHPWNIFPVEIISTEVVGNLKDLIKEKNQHEFNNFDAKNLKQWKVDLPIDDTFDGNLNELELDHKKPLSPVDGMFEVFDSPPQHKHLHIVMRHQ
ncbi:uncharacterized protein F5891DRAFT_1169607 [Suillus fuscotomentosus]|uniref:Crinkler effector protein N-terminal domain-containing protein n=1 Tax=Suillus fuscotomentosus TaxID=1912939 RepID=A0AAD4HU96_9AGAM|nr:uncharacterized protein F5891DRAFT_1169607 [Suillus fuscotomentosus]KAG1907469.1 hypothetical protein F5891DRAFT_1169607 [Suillus fuscotomentosus]